MEKADVKFIADILEKSRWLLYGDLDAVFDGFLHKVFEHELKDWGFGDVKMTDDFATAYWLFISEMEALDLVGYGTSPRGAWLTEDGERFKKIVMENEDAVIQGNEYIYNKYHEGI
jgi:lipopolysaccharide biosynthesis glycosyltransferase